MVLKNLAIMRVCGLKFLGLAKKNRKIYSTKVKTPERKMVITTEKQRRTHSATHAKRRRIKGETQALIAATQRWDKPGAKGGEAIC